MNYLKIYSKRIVIVLLSVVCFVLSSQSQVTIGSHVPPLKGALLDLKESNDLTGNANSKSGLMLARVALTDENNLFPMLSGTEQGYNALKPGYTGLTVYNVNTNSPFEKGIYVWDGTKWNSMKGSLQSSSITAKNGLSTPDGKTVELGGYLEENTSINLNDYILNFNSNQGRIGIDVSDPEAILDIENNQANGDPLILKNVKNVSDANTVDGAGVNYYGLRVSENGVIRKAVSGVSNSNQSFIYNLNKEVDINIDGSTSGTSGTDLSWSKGSTGIGNEIILPETGTFLFSFRLYGGVSGGNTPVSNSFYISAFKNNNIHYTQEIVLRYIVSTWPCATYSITIPVSGVAGDKIRFRMGRKTGGAITWTLRKGDDKMANRTSMVFWKL